MHCKGRARWHVVGVGVGMKWCRRLEHRPCWPSIRRPTSAQSRITGCRGDSRYVMITLELLDGAQASAGAGQGGSSEVVHQARRMRPCEGWFRWT